MTAIILAGGKSSRFGQDKAFIRIKGKPLIKRQLKFLKRIFKRIIIVSNRPDKYKFKGIKVVRDIIPHRGPLGGIYSGLMASSSFYNFTLACDMPFINVRLIKYMIGLKDGYDVVVPRLKKGYETLFAIYSKNCIKPIENRLLKQNFKIRSFFTDVKVRTITQKEIAQFDKEGLCFININTPKDYRRFRDE